MVAQQDGSREESQRPCQAHDTGWTAEEPAEKRLRWLTRSGHRAPAGPHWHRDPWTTFGHYGPSLHIAIDLVDDGWFYVDMEARGLSGILIRIVLPYITPPWTAPENYTVLQRAMVLMVLRCGAVRALASLVNAPKKMPLVVPDL